MAQQNKPYYDVPRLNDLDIVEVARHLNLRIHRVGIHHRINCLWHGDQHPSMTLYNQPGHRHCHCYSCDAHHSVIDLAMQAGEWNFQEACQWLSQEFGVSTTNGWHYFQAPRQTPAKPQEPPYSYLPMEMVEAHVSTGSSLVRCLMHMAHSDKALWTPQTVEWQVEEYRIGSYTLGDKEDWTIFPCIDFQGRACNLKVQHYDTRTDSPRFCHDDIGQSYWLATMWLKEGRLKYNDCPKADKVRFRNDCLFGEHLLKHYPSATVALVESPKNALFGALAFPELLWIAAGNKNNLNRRVLEPLRGRDVIVIPDRDAIPSWTERLNGMPDLANFTVSDFCQRYAPEDQLKFDIADYLQLLVMPCP